MRFVKKNYKKLKCSTNKKIKDRVHNKFGSLSMLKISI